VDRLRLGYLSGAPRVSTRPEASASGPRAHVLGVISGFQALGWEVKPFIFGDEVPLPWVEKEGDVELSQSWVRRLVADLLRLGLGGINSFRALRKLGRVDWVYERFGAFQALGYLFQRRGVPWILETNGIFFVEADQDRKSLALKDVERKVELWAYRQADVVVAVSSELKELLVEHGVSARKVLVVPNGVDISRFAPKPVEYQNPIPVLGFVGTLSIWQALDVLLKALAHLKGEGVIYHLVVVGDGLQREAWEKMAGELGLADQVRFVGRVPGDEVPNWIAGFDLAYSGQVPTASGRMYHSPLKLYEYMAMAKPVVASALGDAKTLIGEDERGYLFLPGDVEDLARALRKAYQERHLWPVKGQKARELIVREHSWEARVRDMVAQVEGILEEKYGTPYPARR
jgi:glycosyltransferase involved in cell wall biosynthesis